MNRFLPFCALLAVLSVLSACTSNDAQPQENNLLRNGSVEQQSQNWFFNYDASHTANPNGFAFGHTDEAASSPRYSLKINCNTVKNDSAFCFYGQNNIPVSAIPVGAKLTLTAKIKPVNLTGQGVAIAIRGDKGSQVMFFQTTQGTTPITGTSEFKQYSVTLDNYPGNIDNLLVFMVYLPRTTGHVYFDDLMLTVNN